MKAAIVIYMDQPREVVEGMAQRLRRDAEKAREKYPNWPAAVIDGVEVMSAGELEQAKAEGQLQLFS